MLIGNWWRWVGNRIFWDLAQISTKNRVKMSLYRDNFFDHIMSNNSITHTSCPCNNVFPMKWEIKFLLSTWVWIWACFFFGKFWCFLDVKQLFCMSQEKAVSSKNLIRLGSIAFNLFEWMCFCIDNGLGAIILMFSVTQNCQTLYAVESYVQNLYLFCSKLSRTMLFWLPHE